jgi:hypothetical protein
MTKDSLHTSSFDALIRTFFPRFTLSSVIFLSLHMKTHPFGLMEGSAMALLIWPSQSASCSGEQGCSCSSHQVVAPRPA